MNKYLLITDLGLTAVAAPTDSRGYVLGCFLLHL